MRLKALVTGVTFFTLAILSSLLLAMGTDSPQGLQPLRELSFTLLAMVFGGAALALLWLSRHSETFVGFNFSSSSRSVDMAGIALLALALRLIAAQAWPPMEDDFWRYLWDGRQLALTGSPWAQAPAAFFGDTTLSLHWQTVLDGINHPELPSIYGPIWQGLFVLAYWLAPGQLAALQTLMIMVDLVILFILYRQGLHWRWLLAYAVHPLILHEAIAAAHPDIMLALFLLLALQSWQREAPLLCGLSLGCAVAGKVSALVTLPFFLLSISSLSELKYLIRPQSSDGRVKSPWSRRWLHGCRMWHERLYALIYSLTRLFGNNRRWLLRLVSGVVLAELVLYLPLYVPLLANEGSEWFSLKVFAQSWRFNPLLFQLFELLASSPFDRVLAALSVVVIVAVLWGWWLLQWQQSFFDHRAISAPDRVALLPPLDLALTALLLCSPVVNNWYWCWVLPLAIALRRGWLVAGCLLGSLSYINGANLLGVDWPQWLNPDALEINWFEKSWSELAWFEVPISITAIQLVGLLLCWWRLRRPSSLNSIVRPQY